MKWCTRAVLLLGMSAPAPAGAQPVVDAAELEPLVTELQSIVETSDTPGFLALLAPGADVEEAREFARDALREEISAAVVLPRFLLPLEDMPEGTGYKLTVEVFTERGDRGRLQTWQLDVTLATSTDSTTPAWQIARHVSLDSLEGLHHLTLNTSTQYNAENLTVAGEDMTLRLSRGVVFVSETDGGVTALVLIGNGTLTFSPAPEAERRQIQIFSGHEILEAEFTQAFVRLNPAMFDSHVSTATLVETTVDDDDLERAQELFDEVAPRTFSIELDDLSDRSWWITPQLGDFIAELRTRRYGDLTYAQAQNQPEDISLYARNPSRVISLYPSASKRRVRGRYYSDQAGSRYDVLDYNIDASFEPRGVIQESLGSRQRLRGCWIEGVTRVALRVTARNVRSLTLRLNNDLHVQAVTSRELGPLLFFRMRNQNNIVVNLPSEAPIGTEFTLTVAYSGLLEAEALDENWIGRVRYLSNNEEELFGVIERRYLYSNASYWYPQATVSDYATATMTVTIPADYGIVASGDPDDGNPPVSSVEGATGTRRYTFVTLQPTRYLACLITRFAENDIPVREVALERRDMIAETIRAGVSYDSLALAVEGTKFSRDRIGDFSTQSAELLKFYASLLGDIPYPTFTLALSDSRLPGGHSPAYFAVLNQLVPMRGGAMLTWHTDPVAFSGHPSFFLAHELAHQWWGQAVGWKNYHEQWLSEGLAQYFAALHVQQQDGDEAFEDILSELRRWSLRHSDQGPVYLGFRLGQIDDEPRVFRALVYNKAALVLHMLRRLIGDDAFFNGLRRFYHDMRFRVAGTDDLVRALETEAKRSLKDFFERWIHDFDLPTLRFDYYTETRLSGQQRETVVVLRFEQEGTPFEIPVTATLRYRQGPEETVVVPVAGQLTEFRVPLSRRLRDVKVNEDNAALAEIRR